MASLTSSSRRSSSSYRSSSRYSTSSSYRSEGSLGGSSDSLDPLFEPFLDSADHSSLFGEEGPGGPSCLAPFSRHSRSSYGHTAPAGGAVTGRQSSTGGGVRCLGDSYYMSADVSQFEPHDVVVMAYNHHVVIHAQKVLDDGSISDTFTHKSLFPEDMDPLSVSGTLNPDGTLVVSVRRTTALAGLEPLGVPTYRSEAHL
ncbi:heat shock protein beta-7-like [Dicentrarchus labrax]|uniref:heat shock protein beta-7-like n=1 Tax=Dicentrarchus labrax TaxID=13489 RepID=UPI0021F50003|nr:heat shock protein beta-7-like [Dicentrarchus labrax]XP_051253477.1 heat shock protein beta-7-like [Dicentrarchus labrax]XP_051253478.1 heat shock protein beta-7-like [Dicentrarchus labrax]